VPAGLRPLRCAVPHEQDQRWAGNHMIRHETTP
jgi:hypothetical protein